MNSKRILIIPFLLLVLVSSFAFATLDDAELYYSFDNSTLTGNNPGDISGNNNNGTNNGATIGVPGKLEEAFSFDGVNDWLDTNYDLGTVWTINTWIYFPTFSTQGYFYGVRNSGGTQREFQGVHSASSTIGFNFYDGGTGNAGSFSGTITENSWNMITLTRNGNSVQLFVNNVSQATDSTTGKGNINENLIAGRLGNAGVTYFNGQIDEFSIYNRVINSTEISELYNSGAGLNPYAQPGNFTITVTNTNTFNATVNSVFYNTSNGAIVTPLLRNESILANITIQAENYVSKSFVNWNTSTNIVTNLAFTKIDINFYNEIDNTLVLTNVSSIITDIEGSSQTKSTTNGTVTFFQMQQGILYDLAFTAAGYVPSLNQIFYSSEVATLNVYLLPSSQAYQNATITVQDNLGNSLAGADIQVERFVNGSYVITSQLESGVTGVSQFPVIQGVLHRITISKEGFVTKIFTDRFYILDIVLRMQSDVAGVYGSPFDGITTEFMPQEINLYNGNIYNFSYSVGAINQDLEYFGFIVYNGSLDSTPIYSQQLTTSAGGTIIFNLNVSAYNGSTLYAYGYFKKTGFSEQNSIKYYVVSDAIFSGTFLQLRAYMANNLSLFNRYVLFLIVSLLSFIVFTLYMRNELTIIIPGMLTIFYSWVFSLPLLMSIFLIIIFALYGISVGRKFS